MSSKTIIIGYGNPSRSDDGLGWHAVRRLSEEIGDPRVEILTLHQLTPELAEPLSRAGRVIFIDASAEGEPATLGWRRIDPGEPLQSALCHHLTPQSLVALAEVLYGRAPEAFAVSVTGESFDFGEDLSASVSAALPGLVGLVRDILAGSR